MAFLVKVGLLTNLTQLNIDNTLDLLIPPEEVITKVHSKFPILYEKRMTLKPFFWQ